MVLRYQNISTMALLCCFQHMSIVHEAKKLIIIIRVQKSKAEHKFLLAAEITLNLVNYTPWEIQWCTLYPSSSQKKLQETRLNIYKTCTEEHLGIEKKRELQQEYVATGFNYIWVKLPIETL